MSTQHWRAIFVGMETSWLPIPNEILQMIIDYCEPPDVYSLVQTSTQWRDALEDQTYWRARIRQTIGFIPPELSQLESASGDAVLSRAGPYLVARSIPVSGYGKDRDWYLALSRFNPAVSLLTTFGTALLGMSALYFCAIIRFAQLLDAASILRASSFPPLRWLGKLANMGWHGLWLSALGIVVGFSLSLVGTSVRDHIASWVPGKDYEDLDLDHASFSELNRLVDWKKVGREALINEALVSKALFLSEHLARGARGEAAQTISEPDTEFDYVRWQCDHPCADIGFSQYWPTLRPKPSSIVL